MTKLSDTVTENTQTLQKVSPPTIESEIDIPFDANNCADQQRPAQGNLSKTDSLDDEIVKFKYLTGRQVLFLSMGAMGLAVVVNVALSIFKIENALVENAFEVFKLIAMTVLGYIFGTKTK